MHFPLSFRSQSTWAILIFGFISLLVVIEVYLPKDVTVQYGVGGAFVAAFVVGVTYSILGSRLKGGPHPHAIVTARRYPSGNPEQRDFFFEVSDPLKREIDIFPVMDIGYHCSHCHAWRRKPEEVTNDHACKTCGFPVKAQPVPKYWQRRFWWPYLVRTAFAPVYWTGVGEFSLHLMVLPMPWERFFGSHKRELGAYLLGEAFDKGDSDCVTMYLAPFAHSLLDEPIALYLGVEGTGTYKMVTSSWAKTMEQLAKMAMEKVMTDYKDDIFPTEEVENMVAKQAKEALNKKVAEAARARSSKER